jgi:NAD(P)-dependent dehydrogenase (short-subunit alcohol dehydrogenase family)
LFSYTLAEDLDPAEITSNCLHPGAVDTKMLNAIFPSMNGISTMNGASTSVYLAVSQEVNGITGKYFNDSRQTQSSELSYDKELQEEMWQYCLDRVTEFL